MRFLTDEEVITAKKLIKRIAHELKGCVVAITIKAGYNDKVTTSFTVVDDLKDISSSLYDIAITLNYPGDYDDKCFTVNTVIYIDKKLKSSAVVDMVLEFVESSIALRMAL